MKSFRIAEARMKALHPVGQVYAQIRQIKLLANISAPQLFIHLTTGGKFQVRYDLNKSLACCFVDLVQGNVRMRNMSIQRHGDDIIIKLKG